MAHDVLPFQMWKSVVGHNVSMKVADKGDDWETDPDFEVLPGYYVSLSCVCVLIENAPRSIILLAASE